MMMKQKHQQLGEEGGVLMTEDLYTVGNDEVYIVFMEDSATFGSSETTEGTDDDAAEDGVMITIMRRIHRLNISGPTEDCDDFGLAFDAGWSRYGFHRL